jgi:CDP-diacylglycerol--serine O-phosphatidyltransferase
MKKLSILPSLLTLGNAFCGFLAISYIVDAAVSLPVAPDGFGDKLVDAAWLILLAQVFDALDGKVARMTAASSEFGGQLDSLCDAISFGVAPALLVKVLVEQAVRAEEQLRPHPRLYILAAAFFVVCVVLRLARFNVESAEDEGHDQFTGLPSPAAAGILASLVLVYFHPGEPRVQRFESLTQWIDFDAVRVTLRRTLPFLLPLLGLLMISRVRYAHLLNWLLRERKAFPFLAEVLIVLFFLAIEPKLTLAVGFVVYVLLGPAAALRGIFVPARARVPAEPPPD